jgi:hypothetical protein
MSEPLRTAPLPRHRGRVCRTVFGTILREPRSAIFQAVLKARSVGTGNVPGVSASHARKARRPAAVVPHGIRFTGTPRAQGMPVWTGRACTC